AIMFGPTPNGKTTLRIFPQEAKMISAKQISDAFDEATREFAATPSYLALIAGQAVQEEWRDFIGNVFRTHYLSSQIVALCFASLPSNAAALLRENLMGEDRTST